MKRFCPRCWRVLSTYTTRESFIETSREPTSLPTRTVV
jgi:hypothetical protein